MTNEEKAEAIFASFQTLMREIGQPDLAERSMDEAAFELNDENDHLFSLVISMGNAWERAMGYSEIQVKMDALNALLMEKL